MKKYLLSIALIFLLFFDINAHVDHYSKYNYLEYELFRNNKSIGYHKYNFKRNGSNLIIDNEVSQEYSYNFIVTRVGIEEAIYSFSKNYPFCYGLISLIIAIIIGWSGAEIFKRFRRI